MNSWFLFQFLSWWRKTIYTYQNPHWKESPPQGSADRGLFFYFNPSRHWSPHDLLNQVCAWQNFPPGSGRRIQHILPLVASNLHLENDRQLNAHVFTWVEQALLVIFSLYKIFLFVIWITFSTKENSDPKMPDCGPIPEPCGLSAVCGLVTSQAPDVLGIKNVLGVHVEACTYSIWILSCNFTGGLSLVRSQ